MAQPNFHPELENVQQEFEQRLKAQEGALTPEKEKEVLKQVIAEKFQAQPQTQTQAQAQDQDQNDEKNAIAPVAVPLDPKIQYQMAVDSLINMAFDKGLSQAIKEVRNMGNAFLIDAFHDELVDKFYLEIKSREDA